MVILLKGIPFQGAVGFSAWGPFHSDDEAASWAVAEWEGEPEWFMMTVNHPEDYNSGEDDEGEDEFEDKADAEPTEISPEELERMIEAERNKKRLPKEVMFDLSEIPVGI